MIFFKNKNQMLKIYNNNNNNNIYYKIIKCHMMNCYKIKINKHNKKYNKNNKHNVNNKK